MLSPEEREKVLYTFNNTLVNFPGEEVLHEIFSAQAVLSPDRIAVVCGSQQLTYAELDTRSNQLALYLTNAGIQQETLIGICLDRSIEMIVAILGTMKAGGAYLPIDPDYPSERINFMLDDSGIRIFLSTEQVLKKLNATLAHRTDLTISAIDKDWTQIQEQTKPVFHQKTGSENLAYVIYTSGSTGKPKGVMNEHGGIVNRLQWAQSYFQLNADDVVLQKTTFCFDVSVWELFWPLMVGSKLVFASPGGQKDSGYLETIINSQRVTTIHFVPSMLEIFLLGIEKGACKGLKRVLCSGEELTQRQASFFMEKLGHAELYNLYGPTEAAIDVSCFAVPENPQKIFIGKPVANTSLYVLDENMEPCAIGAAGELYIGGIQVARAYLNRPELNEAKFLRNPFAKDENKRLYRTGDKARWHDDGNLEYLGRADDQLKIRGFRIEPGEIENAILQSGNIRQCVVYARTDAAGEKKLIACIIPSSPEFDDHILKTHLKDSLPEYMVPDVIMQIDHIPLNSNGKADRSALPDPGTKRPDLRTLYKAPLTDTEKLISKLWKSILELDQVGINDNFFELGGNSLRALRFVAILKQQYHLELPVTRLYQFPFIDKIASFLSGKKEGIRKPVKKLPGGGDIAVIGMAGRFPGANTPEELWSVLSSGEETISFFTEEQLDKSIPEKVRNNPDYVKARGIIDAADKFDPAFFGMNSRLAELMDPQQRIFLEIAWEALESTGHLPDHYNGKTGVFAGSGSNTYYLNNVHSRPDLIASAGNFQVSTLNEKDYIAMRTAYELDLKGPAVSVYSACSTSLLAIAQAVESLRKGQCDIALAGGVSITSPVNSGHVYEEGAMLSRDGHCRPFDAKASGTVFSDGAGVVLLKTLEEAERDGDTVYAILKGIGLNNDGAGKASFTAPDPAGQADAIRMAIEDAGIEASSISYVETHGTATPLGDPIEIEGLKMAFGLPTGQNFCAIGSVKSNMGHLTHAAGVAGFIKTVLALYHRQIPPSLFYEKPNPNIDFENSPFYVNTGLIAWDSDKIRRAGVSSFGVGGTNVHVILQESASVPLQSTEDDKPQLIIWSAKNEASLDLYNRKLVGFLYLNPTVHLSDIAATLQQTRKDFTHRRFIIASDTAELTSILNSGRIASIDTKIIAESASEVAFIFPGQGSQYLHMGLEIYNREPIFKQAIDQCADILYQWLKADIREIIYSWDKGSGPEEKLQDTRYTQPALFVTEYAMARLWLSWGIQPAALAGHSIGEFVAAHLAGIFSLEDALKVVSERARLISELPGGSMLAIKMLLGELEKQLPGNLSIAAMNSPDLSVVSGTTGDIEIFSKLMTEKQIANKLLKTSHAFHSSMMDGIEETFGAVMRSVILTPPRIPMVSGVSGKWMSEAEAINPEYWIAQLRLPVRFTDAISTLWEDPGRLLLEVGPGSAAAFFARQQAKGKPLVALPGFENKAGEISEYDAVLRSLGKLWQNGIVPDWKAVNNTGRKISLPTYAFDRKRCWVEPGAYAFESPIIPRAGHISEFREEIEPVQKLQSRQDTLTGRIKVILENASGIEMRNISHDLNFIEIGLDSLLLTQVAITLKKEFTLPVSFRQLNEGLNTINLLAGFLDSGLPEDAFQPGQKLHTVAPSDSVSRQKLTMEEVQEINKPFGASPRIEKQSSDLSPSQAAFLDAFTARYTRKTRKSKDYTEKNRPYMADPRVVSGFTPLTKELVYPIVAKRSKGSRIWDIDGNEYIDALSGFGSNMLGFQPDMLANAIKDQIDQGYEIGPQHELAGNVCKLICEFTQFDRAALCSTGSEAVLGTMRIARTVSGRSLIVAFSGSYHGIFDEVIIRGTKTFRSVPAAPGIMPEAVQNMLILDYGTEESLKIIRERAHELAAVLVEPVQSRHPEFQPLEFLKEVREITRKSGTVLIFDEVITGFRMHPGGAQAMFGIKADLASYGKVIGGGLPIGAIAGKREFMDALDGGAWQFGDFSIPEAGVTYFAGTFVRHPLALVAAQTSLEYFKRRGPALQEELNDKAAGLMHSLSAICSDLQIPVRIVGFGSMWKFKFEDAVPYSELLFTLMREKGIHILDSFPCFVTESHAAEDLEAILTAFRDSVNDLITAGFLLPVVDKTSNFVKLEATETAPVPGARLGRDRDGNPAWFIADPENAGKYMQVIQRNSE